MKPEALKEQIPGIYRAVGKVPLNGLVSMYAATHAVKAEDALVLIDPCRLPESDLKVLEGLGKPSHVILTCGNHVRHTEFYRGRYQVPVLANRKLMSKIEISVDEFFSEGDALPGGLSGIEMPGMALGETVLLFRGQTHALIVGDAMFNYRKEDMAAPMKVLKMLGAFPTGLHQMPGFAMEDKAQAAESCRRLLDFDFDAIFVSHGSPLLSGAKAQWEAVVASL